ncbi:MAG: RAD55 family ATPase [Gemmatimonadaceae bacterium]
MAGIQSSRMIRSGIVPIDELYQGLRPGSTYLLTGGAGAGKTVCSLQFLQQGLATGETVLMVTHATRDDLIACAERLNVPLRTALREERAVLLRYRPDFIRRIVRAGTTDRVLDEIRKLVQRYRPRRLVIDPFGLLLDDGTPSPIAASALAELIAWSQATALLTYADDLAANYDRRVEPIVQSATGVFRLLRDPSGKRGVEAIALRHPSAGPITNDGASIKRFVERVEVR